MGSHDLAGRELARSALVAPDPAAAAALDARRTLFLHLSSAYPTLPVRLILAEVEECESAILLCGDGPDERAVMEVVARRNLDIRVAALARRPRPRRRGP